MVENAAKKQRNPADHLKKYKWPKGVSGNPKGKEPGTLSPKATIRAMFVKNPKRFQEFLEEYIEDPNNRRHLVEMLDGRPHQSGDMEVTLPKSLIELISHAITDKRTSGTISGKD